MDVCTCLDLVERQIGASLKKIASIVTKISCLIPKPWPSNSTINVRNSTKAQCVPRYMTNFHIFTEFCQQIKYKYK